MPSIIRKRDAQQLEQARQLQAQQLAILAKTIPVESRDLFKVRAALAMAGRFFHHRDEMNATLHREVARYSPLTMDVLSARNRIDEILNEAYKALFRASPFANPAMIAEAEAPPATPPPTEGGGESK